ncbi:methyl-accepting chemotaxis protein [Endozoicomonas sp. SM1973]|uniref:Methyl-accepting chemotaxis protein n=1 Tax=Spartinivicinus marinus TaxID=2994442 RepID=A0A853I631_9GAMM|nr:HAMP domain-containing methyl-accepting chemotaxis protein [Spartinivicinus marinus]MCX4030070.1 HAMP domain-containing methyl-accepting chemotaxis protein [Spartinivicinus marinus]NYZ64685.1 methyl-accepting chemotaxis protein [Spartinivicinus marinus]
MNILPKVTLYSILNILIILSVAIISYTLSSRSTEKTVAIIEEEVDPILSAQNLDTHFTQIMLYAITHMTLTEEQSMLDLEQIIEEERRLFENYVDDYRSNIKSILLKKKIDNYVEIIHEMDTTIDQAIHYNKNFDQEAGLNLLLGKGKLQLESAGDLVLQMKNIHRLKIDENKQTVLNNNKVLAKSLALIGCITLTIYICIFIYIKIVFIKPIKQLSNMVSIAKQGDLTSVVSVSTKDEVGMMTRSLQDLFHDRISPVIRNTQSLTNSQAQQASEFAKSFKDIATSSESLKTQSGKISDSSNLMATNVMSVADATVSTSKNISEVNLSIEKSVSLLNNLDKLTKTSVKDIDELSEISNSIYDSIHQVTGQMNQFSNDISTINALSEHSSQAATRSQASVQSTIKVLGELESVTDEIFGFIDQIAEISTQTNVLSLNAAIEACQTADDMGGFRVVAGEVKKLAAQTQQANVKLARLVKTAQTRLTIVMRNCDNAFDRSAEVNDNNQKIAKMMAQQAETIVVVSRNIESISASCTNADVITNRVINSFKEISQSVENNFLATKTMSKNASECESHVMAIVELIKQASEEATCVSKNLKSINKEIVEIDSNVVESHRSAQNMFDAAKELNVLMAFFKV